ncbi:MAG: Uncharacterised protein [Synechococcus sp. MIT S9220]|nr:MAG: Uncharacterised protein [Synechococcus sp. MIT S9220]
MVGNRAGQIVGTDQLHAIAVYGLRGDGVGTVASLGNRQIHNHSSWAHAIQHVLTDQPWSTTTWNLSCANGHISLGQLV